MTYEKKPCPGYYRIKRTSCVATSKFIQIIPTLHSSYQPEAEKRLSDYLLRSGGAENMANVSCTFARRVNL